MSQPQRLIATESQSRDGGMRKGREWIQAGRKAGDLRQAGRQPSVGCWRSSFVHLLFRWFASLLRQEGEEAANPAEKIARKALQLQILTAYVVFFVQDLLAFGLSLAHSQHIGQRIPQRHHKNMRNTEQLRQELATRKREALAKKVRPNPRKPGEDLRSYCARLRTV